MIVRSSVNACCTSSQKSSSWATSSGERPATAWFALTTRASAWSRRAGTAAPAATRDSRKRRRVNIEARLLSGTHQSPHQHAVGDQVHRQHQRAEGRLRRSREAGRVEQGDDVVRSEEHTSELQSRTLISYAVFCLKKKKTQTKYEVVDFETTKSTNITK